MTYHDYRQLIRDLMNKGRVTGSEQSERLLRFTGINEQRMRRIDKTFQAKPEFIASLKAMQQNVIFLTLTEGWCGDSAQIIPVVDALAKGSGIESCYLLRDDHPDLMDLHLWEGKRSIPVVLVLDAKIKEPLGRWGPRPKPALEMTKNYFSHDEKPPYDDFLKSLHLWYAKDRQCSIQDELHELISNISLRSL